MAVKKTKVAESKPMTQSVSTRAKRDKVAMTGWVLLLIGGLAHMMPVQMSPVVSWSLAGITVQMAVGVLSVIVALYYLLGE